MAKEIKLPSPELRGERSLVDVLKDRKTTHSFSDIELPEQELSHLLWAAFGINRPEEGKRTAPSAENNQEIDIYLAEKDGLFLYNAGENVLIELLDKDIREYTGLQDYVADAPVSLIYVADYSKMGDRSKEYKDFHSAADAGFISQNVYLYCASENLATGVRSLIDRDKLRKIMNLRETQKIILAQSVGYPED